MRTEVVYDDGSNTYMLTGEAAQFYADGKALHRLREALPEDTRIEMWSMKWPSGVGRWGITVIGDGFDAPPISVDGSTIAEAADKCREALLVREPVRGDEEAGPEEPVS